MKHSSCMKKDDPTKINYFNGIKIKQIFAKKNISLAITEEGNNIFGWGCNYKNILSKINVEFIGLPMLIHIDFILIDELYFHINSQGSYADILECKILIL